MIKKLFVSDLDGTLLNKDKMIDAHSIDVIKKLKLAGHIFCFATGRGWDECKKYYEQLGLDTPCIIFNGSKMVSPKNKYFIPNTHSISNDVFYQLWNNDELQKEIDYFVIKTAAGNYTSKIPTSPELIKHFDSLFHIDMHKSKNIKKDVLIRTENRHTDALSIILVLKEGFNLTNVIREIKSVTHNIEISKWSIDNKGMSSKVTSRLIIELNNRAANKLNAVQSIQYYLDITDENIYVFGDGENDVKVLNYYNNSIAVKNAGYTALINAHHISRYSNEESAVGKEIENILAWGK